MSWNFYGRSAELRELTELISRRRWFFARLTGRRRIGKTTLVQRALASAGQESLLYVQIPDSAPVGVLAALRDAMDLFAIDPKRFPRPTSLGALAATVGALARAGYVVALDEFQYFSRKKLYPFISALQAVVDELARDASEVSGGLCVLGSIHTEMVALLEDRHAPLFQRTTHEIELDHLDLSAVLEIVRTHAEAEPERLLFLWNLFEGVPKFYRDCFEHGVLGAERAPLLRQMFFRSSSPLRSEADHWFLRELRGRYDVLLRFVARNPGCSNGDIRNYVQATSPETAEQIGGYLKTLSDRYRMIERRLPLFARPRARRPGFGHQLPARGQPRAGGR